jgi:acetyl-CoA carboxylase carboxyltransferase component
MTARARETRELEPNPSYHWITVPSTAHRFLRHAIGSLGMTDLRFWTETSVSAESFDRIRCRGLITAMGEIGGRTVALVWSDFRIDGGSFGRQNSGRFRALLQHLRQAIGPAIPLVYFVNSAGLSLMEGRQAFSDGFALWPELLRFGDRHLILTCATGKCLGLAPLLFGLGHYRLGVTNQTRINLTGPEVIRMFFGQGVDFDQRASAERWFERTDLIHELVPSVEAACARFRALLGIGPVIEATGPSELGARSLTLLESFLDCPPDELIPGWCPRVRVLVGTAKGKRLGIFLNPIERSDNLITVRTLDKYAAGLDLFRAMGLPVVSLLDSPGIDPRFDQSDANNVGRILAVGQRIIRYPHGTMGVVAGRCYGGASTLSFPKIFGGHRLVALRGAAFGTMHPGIIERVLGQSPRLLAQWRATASTQDGELHDLLTEGSVDAVIDRSRLADEIDRFLTGSADRRSMSRANGPRSFALDSGRLVTLRSRPWPR